MKHSNYFDMLEAHRSAVKQVWTSQLRPILAQWGQDESQLKRVDSLIEDHDKSKYTPNEFPAYEKHFTSDIDECTEDYEFDKAWLHHQNTNLHHWQYWVLIKDDDEPLVPINMPFEYICEMVCDWQSFAISDPGNTARRYYESRKRHMIMSDYTRTTLEILLNYLDEPVGDQ